MVVKESLQFAVEDQYRDFQDPYEEEETLSLCDLPIHDDSFKWEDESFSNNSHGRRSNSFDKDDFFEFFSEDFTASAYNPSGKDIIFCGKLIPYREPPLLPDHHHQQQQQQQTHENHQHHHQKTTSCKKPTKNKGYFQWKSYSFDKGSKNGENSFSKPQKAVNDKSSINNKKLVYKTSKSSSDLSLGQVSLFSAPAKSRWHLFMFGIARLPTSEMELRDIKTRQSRKIPSATMFSSFGDEEIVKEKVVKRKKSRAKGLWGLLRVLGCSSSLYSNAVAKGSFGCNIPQDRDRASLT